MIPNGIKEYCQTFRNYRLDIIIWYLQNPGIKKWKSGDRVKNGWAAYDNLQKLNQIGVLKNRRT